MMLPKLTVVLGLVCLPQLATAAPPDNGCADPTTHQRVALRGAPLAQLRAICEAGSCADACAIVLTKAKDPRATEAELGPIFYTNGLTQRCFGGEAVACAEAGDRLYDGAGTLAQPDGACQAWGAGCDAGNANACNHLGYCEADGIGRPADVAAGVARLEKGCAAGDGRACFGIGQYAARLPGDAAAHTKDAMDRACAADYAAGCTVAGALRNDAGELEAGRVLLEEGCRLGSSDGCRFAGNLYAEGHGVSQSLARAVEFHNRGCELGSGPACRSAGARLMRGEGVAKDEARALALFRRGCAADDATACGYAAMAVMQLPAATTVTAQLDEAFSLVSKACSLGDQASCERRQKLCSVQPERCQE